MDALTSEDVQRGCHDVPGRQDNLKIQKLTQIWSRRYRNNLEIERKNFIHQINFCTNLWGYPDLRGQHGNGYLQTACLLFEPGKYFGGRMSVSGSSGAAPPWTLRLTFCRENTFQAQRGDWQSASSQCHIDLRGHQANLKNKTLTIAIYFWSRFCAIFVQIVAFLECPDFWGHHGSLCKHLGVR